MVGGPLASRGLRATGPLGREPSFSKTLLTQQQLDLELPQILVSESDSELNGEYTFHSRLILD